MELHGITGKPYKHPEVRKKIPVFNRPRIDLDGGRRVKRSWQDLAAHKIGAGDTVAGFGTVEKRFEFINTPDWGEGTGTDTMYWKIRLINIMGEHRDYSGEHRVFVFAPDPEQ
jgi:hypothetical protein